MLKIQTEQQAPYRRRACALPWTTLLLDNNGDISFCCFLGKIANLYQMSDNALEEVWNGRIARAVRQKWVEGRLEGLRCANCPGIQRFGGYAHHALEKPELFQGSNPAATNATRNLDEFIAGRIRLQSMPLEIVYIPSVVCNISCIHCFQSPPDLKCIIQPEHLIRFYYLLGSRAIVHIVSGGEPLVIPAVEMLHRAMSEAHRAASEMVFQTNGQLLKDRFDRFSGYKKYHVRISIAGFRKDIYEYIHRGAKFEKLLSGIDALNEARSKLDVTTSMVMVLMSSNFRELTSIFDFANERRFDDVWVTPVHAAYGRKDALRYENIFEFPDLLDNIPEWPSIIDRAMKRAMLLGRKLTFSHLEYIKEELTRLC